jgi:hypothetical protein
VLTELKAIEAFRRGVLVPPLLTAAPDQSEIAPMAPACPAATQSPTALSPSQPAFDQVRSAGKLPVGSLDRHAFGNLVQRLADIQNRPQSLSGRLAWRRFVERHLLELVNATDGELSAVQATLSQAQVVNTLIAWEPALQAHFQVRAGATAPLLFPLLPPFSPVRLPTRQALQPEAVSGTGPVDLANGKSAPAWTAISLS